MSPLTTLDQDLRRAPQIILLKAQDKQSRGYLSLVLAMAELLYIRNCVQIGSGISFFEYRSTIRKYQWTNEQLEIINIEAKVFKK